ncbi:MAG: transcription initiation factor IIB [Candidatus Heimdallarchaeota archaeon]|nr:transcription initiation factor IIB [Candidatus Heimdallarchaeota archaeon]
MPQEPKCPECGSVDIVSDFTKGTSVCASCGLVLDFTLDTGPEWRAYDSSELQERSRTGSPITPLKAEMGLRTQIGNIRKDISGKTLPFTSQTKYRRLSRIDNRTRKSEIRNLRFALKELKRIKSQLELPDDVAEMGAMIYRKALKKNLIRGRSIDGMIAASLYLACRKKKLPQTLKDIASVSNISAKELGRCIRIILQKLDLKVSPSDYSALVYRLGINLRVTMKARRQAVKILNIARSRGATVGKNPMSLAAAALYISTIQTGERRTQQEIASIAKITPVTIRNRFKELVKILDAESKRTGNDTFRTLLI